MNYTLKNEYLEVTIASHGAELRSVRDLASGEEYMWNGDSTYWGRVSPVLFPVVGNYRDHESVFEGKTYTLGQHGFARDTEFALVSQSDDEIWFEMTESEATLQVYPFRFLLQLGYRLEGRTVTVLWTVKNPETRAIYFSIGAHPAFLCDLHTDSLYFTTKDTVLTSEYLDGPCVGEVTREIALTDGILPLSEELLADGALILERNHIKAIELRHANGQRNVTVAFDTPAVGIWSPEGKNAPFVCIEPWYGRADRTDYNKQLETRELGNKLEAGEEFRKSYTITFQA